LVVGGICGSAFADPQMRGEDSVRFLIEEKEITVRLPGPGKRGALMLIFRWNR
jgi:hypothetical protein